MGFSNYQHIQQFYLVTAVDVASSVAVINIPVKQYCRVNHAEASNDSRAWCNVVIYAKSTPEDNPSATLASGKQSSDIRFHGLYEGYIDHFQILISGSEMAAGDRIFYVFSVARGEMK